MHFRIRLTSLKSKIKVEVEKLRTESGFIIAYDVYLSTS